MDVDHINEITGAVVDAAMRVHTRLGPGLLESAYESCLAYELLKRRFRVERQAPIPLLYDGVRLDVGYRADMIVESAVLVENKALAKVLPIHEAQLISYLKIGDFRVGLLFNFNVRHLKDGITRIANGI